MAAIETTLGALVGAEPALGRLLALPLPVKAAYHLVKLSRLVQAETSIFNGLRDKAVRELGSAIPGQADGWEINQAHANWATFVERMNKIAAETVTIPWGPIALQTFGDIQITGADLLALDPLLTKDVD